MEEHENIGNIPHKENAQDRIGNNELYNLLVSRELSWQAIIYDLIKTEQLDPWDIDLTLLTKSYLEKIQELEEAHFYISSKILLAAAILLRIKSEMLLSRHLRSLDEILFGRPEEKQKPEFNFNIDDVSDLLPKSPLPRARKVTLPELMAALNRAMTTEHRRIKKEISVRHALTRFDMYLLPKNKINVKERIKEVYSKIKSFFSKEESIKMTYSSLAPTKEEKLNSFMPVLHLDNQERILLEQLNHFDEIYIYMKTRTMSEEELANKIKERENAISLAKNGDGIILEDKLGLMEDELKESKDN